MRPLSSILFGSTLVHLAAVSGAPFDTQAPLATHTTAVALQPLSRPERTLRGRFLHLTDLHPDPWYEPGTRPSKACHRKWPKDGQRAAGYWGTPFSDCDSPFRLTNFTLDFLDENWADEIDFVVWTGDSARHDNDKKRPRGLDEVFELNRAVASKMQTAFTRRGIPVIPSLGNNDVAPHNSLSAGPNDITKTFASIWKPFIPSASFDSFTNGAYFSIEVVPGRLAVISLNTMYFYNSNKAGGGCELIDKEDPGNLEFDWLESQLERYRIEGIQVWVTGHVPPSSDNYFPECYVRYTDLALRYQSVILGHLYGHMNVDHFFFLDAQDLSPEREIRRAPARSLSDEELYDALINNFAELPDEEDARMDDYAAVNVAPPVVPNPYLPSFRVFSYNISTAFDSAEQTLTKQTGARNGQNSKACDEDERHRTWSCELRGRPWYSDSESPSRRNALWTPLGYAQYHIPRLDDADRRHEPEFELEYLTHALSSLHPPEDGGAANGKGFVYPVPREHLPRSLRNATIRASKYAPYEMTDLTIPSWLELARKLGAPKRTKLREEFRRFMFQGGEAA